MTRRRPIYRKTHEQPTSRKGLLLCLVLAGAVVLVPVGGGFMNAAKQRLRNAALASGIITLDDCVITAAETLACASGVVGTPVPVALRRMVELEAEAAESAERRDEAEAAVRTLTAEIDRLNAEAEQARVATHTDLAPIVTTVTRTGTTAEGTGEMPIQVISNPVSNAAPVVDAPALQAPAIETYEPPASEE